MPIIRPITTGWIILRHVILGLIYGLGGLPSTVYVLSCGLDMFAFTFAFNRLMCGLGPMTGMFNSAHYFLLRKRAQLLELGVEY